MVRQQSGPWEKTSAVNDLDMHNRDVDHLVQELQPWSHRGLLNSKTLGIRLCTTTGKSTTIDELHLRIFRSFLQF